MPDTWINTLVVSGPAAEVAAFRSAVTDSDAKPVTSLSFRRLEACLSGEERADLDAPMEPWNDWVADADSVGPPEEHVRPEPGMLGLEYDFSLARYEPDELLIRASRKYQNLCFVLGWVAPSNDEHRSRFIHSGRTQMYDAPDARVDRLRSKAYRRNGLDYEAAIENGDFDLSADIEGDWAVLRAVVAHWNGKVHRTLRALHDASAAPH